MDMSVAAPQPIRIPLAAWLASIVGMFVLYLALQENGALLSHAWENLHEFFHDGRHFLGVPCH